MKRGGVIVLAMSCFIIGMLYSLRGQVMKVQSATVPNTQFLNEQIEQYEESLDEDEPSFIPYSQTVQEAETQKGSNSNSDVPTPLNQISGIGHNNISKVGQDIGNLLKTIVREVLRTVVRSFDRVISES